MLFQEKDHSGCLFSPKIKLLGLLLVYKMRNLRTMSSQNSGKLNLLLAELGDMRLVSSRWLRAHGYSNSLIARYVKSGWLVSPARGVYMRKRGRLLWEGVIQSLQFGEGISLYVGGRFALSLLAHQHSLRLGDAGTITLFGSLPPPTWLSKLALAQRFEYLGNGPFDLPPVSLVVMSEQDLSGQGLVLHQFGPGADRLVCAAPERAILELCGGVATKTLIYEIDALMQAMTMLRPQHVELLLRRCRSIKAKRLFLALAERHQHEWLKHVSLEGIELGRGKRALVPGGRLHAKYQITLPGDLDEQLAWPMG